MVKIGALVSAVIAWIGTITYILFARFVLISSENPGIDNNYPNGDVSWQEFQYFMNVNKVGFGLIGMIVLFLYLGMVIVFVNHMLSKKVFLLIGGIIGSIGAIWLFLGQIGTFGEEEVTYSGTWFIGAIILFVGLILYLVGLIQYRANYKIGLIMGPIIVILGLIYLIILPMNIVIRGLDYWYQANAASTEQAMNTLLIFQIIFFIVFDLNALLFSFSKKYADEDELEEEISVEADNAFASYVPENMKKDKKKKKKKGQESDEIEFTF